MSGPPSYSESLTDSTSPASSFSFYPQNQSATRNTIISNLIRTYIEPHLDSNAHLGLSQSTLILIPSNSPALIAPKNASSDSKDPQSESEAFPGEVIVGFPTSENIALVRLRGHEHTLEFWRQPAVVGDLEQRLRGTLRSDGLEVFIRTSSDAQWRHLEEKALGEGEARIGTEIKEVCLRIENQLGLYETRTGKALVVRVDFGSSNN